MLSRPPCPRRCASGRCREPERAKRRIRQPVHVVCASWMLLSRARDAPCSAIVGGFDSASKIHLKDKAGRCKRRAVFAGSTRKAASILLPKRIVVFSRDSRPSPLPAARALLSLRAQHEPLPLLVHSPRRFGDGVG